MILSYAKPFNQKMHKQPAQIWKKRIKHLSHFSVLSIGDMRPKKKTQHFSNDAVQSYYDIFQVK